MFTAIIADDEKKVCQLIHKSGNWDELGIEIVAICYDGEDALASIVHHKPDIVLTDIRMPIYDGLVLIAKTKELEIDSVFILISGYRHFEYAHSAMQFGVADYLLKPIDKDQLNNTLEKICKSLIEKRMRESTDNVVRQIVSDNRIRLQTQLVDDLTKGKNLFAYTIPEINNLYKTRFHEGMFQVLLVNTDMLNLHLENMLFGEKVMTIAEKQFSQMAEVFAVATDRGVVCVLNYHLDKSNAIRNQFTFFYREILALTEIYGNFNLAIGAGIVVDSITKLQESAHTAELAEKAKIVLTSNKVIESSSMIFQAIDVNEILTAKCMKKLAIALEALNIDEVRGWFEELSILLEGYKNGNPLHIYEARDRIVQKMREFAEFSNMSESEKTFDYIVAVTDRAKSVKNLMYILSTEIVRIAEELLRDKSNQESKPVRSIKQYISENFSRNITLEEVAARVSFSPVYFSTLFKQQVGQSFTEYLTEVRINESKELLRNTNLNIAMIAGLVGYTDDKYFSKLFKKITGIKPNEFRKLYS